MPQTTISWSRTMARLSIRLFGPFGAIVMIATGITAIAHPSSPAKPAASAEPTFTPAASEVVDTFHAVLDRGDTATAAGLLADALVVFEGGEVERSKADYTERHLPADAVFAQAVGSQMTRRSGGTSGDLAWIASEGRTQGRYKGRDINRITTETMILQRVSGVWKIVHVHWSSRAVAAPKL